MSVAGVRIEPVGEDHRSAAVTYVVDAQQDPKRHVTYVGVDSESLIEEFAEVESWTERLLVALVGDDLVGVLLADIDEGMRRVWWNGPWAVDEDVAVALLSDARDRFADFFDEEELAPDSRNEMLRSLALRLGFVAETASSVLTKSDLGADGPAATEPLTATHSDAVAALHDRLFENTHTAGHKLVTTKGTRLRVAQVAGVAVGYIAFEVQADGSGYIDFVGVDPASRRRGLGATLVADACRQLGAEGVTDVHLTVRADLPGAIDLYRSLGFTEERIIVPYRRGFTLG